MLISLDCYDCVEVGELLVSVAVNAANVINDLKENIKNLTGGEMKHYEKLIEKSVERALSKLEKKASEKGYDGVLGVKLSHPHVVDGGVEVVAYGNGFKYKRGENE